MPCGYVAGKAVMAGGELCLRRVKAPLMNSKDLSSLCQEPRLACRVTRLQERLSLWRKRGGEGGERGWPDVAR